MKLYTVKQVAKLAGVSVRALHHYDQIGLLKPASVGENGYRYYGREELLRLQQILFHRELEFPLEAIGAVLDRPDFDRVEALRQHRLKLAAEAGRYGQLLRTLDLTLAELESEKAMDDKQLFKGFDPKKQAQYEAWLVDKFGGDMQADIDRSKKGKANWSKADFAAFKTEGEAIETAMAKALADGLPADSEAIGALMLRLHTWLGCAWNRVPNREEFSGIGRLYMDHPDFRARYEARAEGMTEYLAAAMKAFADREL